MSQEQNSPIRTWLLAVLLFAVSIAHFAQYIMAINSHPPKCEHVIYTLAVGVVTQDAGGRIGVLDADLASQGKGGGPGVETIGVFSVMLVEQFTQRNKVRLAPEVRQQYLDLRIDWRPDVKEDPPDISRSESFLSFV